MFWVFHFEFWVFYLTINFIRKKLLEDNLPITLQGRERTGEKKIPTQKNINKIQSPTLIISKKRQARQRVAHDLTNSIQRHKLQRKPKKKNIFTSVIHKSLQKPIRVGGVLHDTGLPNNRGYFQQLPVQSWINDSLIKSLWLSVRTIPLKDKNL